MKLIDQTMVENKPDLLASLSLEFLFGHISCATYCMQCHVRDQ
jgi:hypothetical protein